MNYKKIGNFIATERKAKKITQAKLAEQLYVSEKTISKWENGKSLPDTEALPKLCEIFQISINELLNGERIASEKYTYKAEAKLLEMQRLNENANKSLLALEIVIGVFGTIFMFALMLIAIFIQMPLWLQIVLIAFGFVEFLTACFISLRIEQKAGYYECEKCHHKYIPTYSQVFWAMHVNRTRYMKCPQCGKKSWHRKVLK